MAAVLLILGIILFIGLVVVHELGHFWAARRNGVEVEEFGIGFPPKAWGKKVGKGDRKFIFSLNWLPLGGFVRLKGEHDSDTEHGTFGAATTWAKTKIMAAGVGMNLVAAFVLLTILAWVGMPQLIDDQFTVASDTHITKSEVLAGYIEPNSPAANAKRYDGGIREKSPLQTQDHIKQIALFEDSGIKQAGGDFAVERAKDLTHATHELAGGPVLITIERDGKTMQLYTQLRNSSEVQASLKTDQPKGYLGVGPTEYAMQRSTWSAPVVAAGVMKQFTVLTFQGLGKALAGVGHIIAGVFTGNTAQRQEGQTAASSQVSGPVGIFVILKDGTLLGYQFVLMVIAIISLSLAIMNVLPIPALDGGKVFVTYISRLFNKRVSEKAEDWIYGSSFLFLLALMALITVVDVKRFF
jgi:regulator of sigma E protease